MSNKIIKLDKEWTRKDYHIYFPGDVISYIEGITCNDTIYTHPYSIRIYLNISGSGYGLYFKTREETEEVLNYLLDNIGEVGEYEQ